MQVTPFIVAELSGNHHKSLPQAIALVDAAANAGANAVKLQTWGEMTVFDGVIESGTWAGKKLKDLYAETRLPWRYHKRIFEVCKERGVIGFSTPFDLESLEFLETLACPIYKIASFEITDLDLIREVGQLRKPMIISTGMASIKEIEEAVETATVAGCGGLTLLKCVSAYPALPSEFNLLTMIDMQARFQCDVGLSDHSRGIGVAVAASAIGASVIEKHLTLFRDEGGPDASFSMEPSEFQQMVYECRVAQQAVGIPTYGPTPSELQSMQFRRSLWITKDLKAGDALTIDNVKSLRPATGLPPDHLKRVLGQFVTRAVPRGTPVSLDLIVPF